MKQTGIDCDTNGEMVLDIMQGIPCAYDYYSRQFFNLQQLTFHMEFHNAFILASPSALVLLMWPSLLALGLLAVFLVLVAWLFWNTVVQVIVNGAILYLIGLRTYSEIKKYRQLVNVYVVAAVIGLAVVLFGGRAWPLWDITLAVVIAFLGAQVYWVVRK